VVNLLFHRLTSGFATPRQLFTLWKNGVSEDVAGWRKAMAATWMDQVFGR
jgi:hypothetical protein